MPAVLTTPVGRMFRRVKRVASGDDATAELLRLDAARKGFSHGLGDFSEFGTRYSAQRGQLKSKQWPTFCEAHPEWRQVLLHMIQTQFEATQRQAAAVEKRFREQFTGDFDFDNDADVITEFFKRRCIVHQQRDRWARFLEIEEGQGLWESVVKQLSA